MTISCATAYSTTIDDATEAASEIAGQIQAKLEPGGTRVGILFASVEMDHEELLRALQAKLGIPIVGCTTYGEATEEGYFESSASLMVLRSDSISIGVGIGQELSKDIDAAVAEAYDSALAALKTEPKLILTFPDAALSYSGEAVLSALDRRNTARAVVIGGCPGDGGQFKKTFQLLGTKVYSDSIPVLMIGGDISPVVVTRSGWAPVGERAQATKIEGNRLVEINGRPAIDYLKRYVGDTDDPEILGTYPIALVDESPGAQAQGSFVLSSPFSYEKGSGAIRIAGAIPEGRTIQLARATREQVLKGVSAAVKALHGTLGEREPSCVLFVSCGGRRLLLGMSAGQEVALLREGLRPGLPIAGFYSYGEIGPLNWTEARRSAPYFHNTTIVLCAL